MRYRICLYMSNYDDEMEPEEQVEKSNDEGSSYGIMGAITGIPPTLPSPGVTPPGTPETPAPDIPEVDPGPPISSDPPTLIRPGPTTAPSPGTVPSPGTTAQAGETGEAGEPTAEGGAEAGAEGGAEAGAEAGAEVGAEGAAEVGAEAAAEVGEAAAAGGLESGAAIGLGDALPVLGAGMAGWEVGSAIAPYVYGDKNLDGSPVTKREDASAYDNDSYKDTWAYKINKWLDD